jgi:hypothetical protein
MINKHYVGFYEEDIAGITVANIATGDQITKPLQLHSSSLNLPAYFNAEKINSRAQRREICIIPKIYDDIPIGVTLSKEHKNHDIIEAALPYKAELYNVHTLEGTTAEKILSLIYYLLSIEVVPLIFEIKMHMLNKFGDRKLFKNNKISYLMKCQSQYKRTISAASYFLEILITDNFFDDKKSYYHFYDLARETYYDFLNAKTTDEYDLIKKYVKNEENFVKINKLVEEVKEIESGVYNTIEISEVEMISMAPKMPVLEDIEAVKAKLDKLVAAEKKAVKGEEKKKSRTKKLAYVVEPKNPRYVRTKWTPLYEMMEVLYRNMIGDKEFFSLTLDDGHLFVNGYDKMLPQFLEELKVFKGKGYTERHFFDYLAFVYGTENINRVPQVKKSGPDLVENKKRQKNLRTKIKKMTIRNDKAIKKLKDQEAKYEAEKSTLDEFYLNYQQIQHDRSLRVEEGIKRRLEKEAQIVKKLDEGLLIEKPQVVYLAQKELYRPPTPEYLEDLKMVPNRRMRFLCFSSTLAKSKIPSTIIQRIFNIIDSKEDGVEISIKNIIDKVVKDLGGKCLKPIKRAINKIRFHLSSRIALYIDRTVRNVKTSDKKVRYKVRLRKEVKEIEYKLSRLEPWDDDYEEVLSRANALGIDFDEGVYSDGDD